MTKEEILQTFGDINHAYNDCTKYDTLKRMLDELTEPCDDAISRQAVDTLVDELARAISDERCCISRGRSTAAIMQDILDLPPVTPKTDVLDKIRADIVELRSRQNVGVLECLDIIDKYKAENTSNCDSCEYQNEVDGSNCYECVKGIRNNYKADSEKEFLPQYEGKWVAESEE